MKAVDTAVCPEVNKHKLVAQITLHGQWCGVEPSVIFGELRCFHLIYLLGGYPIKRLQVASDCIDISLCENVITCSLLIPLQFSGERLRLRLDLGTKILLLFQRQKD